jgi:hypothetical protein
MTNWDAEIPSGFVIRKFVIREFTIYVLDAKKNVTAIPTAVQK